MVTIVFYPASLFYFKYSEITKERHLSILTPRLGLSLGFNKYSILIKINGLTRIFILIDKIRY